MGSFTMDGDRIGFPGLGSTKMYCEKTADLERNFMIGPARHRLLQDGGRHAALMSGATEVASL